MGKKVCVVHVAKDPILVTMLAEEEGKTSCATEGRTSNYQLHPMTSISFLAMSYINLYILTNFVYLSYLFTKPFKNKFCCLILHFRSYDCRTLSRHLREMEEKKEHDSEILDLELKTVIGKGEGCLPLLGVAEDVLII